MASNLLQISIISMILAKNVKMQIVRRNFKRGQDNIFMLHGHGVFAGITSKVY